MGKLEITGVECSYDAYGFSGNDILLQDTSFDGRLHPIYYPCIRHAFKTFLDIAWYYHTERPFIVACWEDLRVALKFPKMAEGLFVVLDIAGSTTCMVKAITLA